MGFLRVTLRPQIFFAKLKPRTISISDHGRHVQITFGFRKCGVPFSVFLFPFVHLHPVMYTFPIGIARFNESCNVSRYAVDPARERSLFLQWKGVGMKGALQN